MTRSVHPFATGGRERLASSGTETLLSPALGDARQHGSSHRSRAVLPPSIRTLGPYNVGVLERTKMRTLPVLNRSADLVPAAQACCGVCRSCMTTNVVTVGAAAVAGAGYFLARHAKRLTRRS